MLTKALLLVTSSLCILSGLADPLTDGSYPIRRGSINVNENFSEDDNALCKEDCNYIHHGGRFSSKVVTYEQDVWVRNSSLPSGGGVTSVFCGFVYSLEITYISNDTLTMSPVDCTQHPESHSTCNSDLCTAWPWTKGFWNSHLPLPYEFLPASLGYSISIDSNTYDFEIGTCKPTCGGLNYTTDLITPYLTAQVPLASSTPINGGFTTCSSSESMNFPLFCPRAEVGAVTLPPSPPVVVIKEQVSVATSLISPSTLLLSSLLFINLYIFLK